MYAPLTPIATVPSLCVKVPSLSKLPETVVVPSVALYSPPEFIVNFPKVTSLLPAFEKSRVPVMFASPSTFKTTPPEYCSIVPWRSVRFPPTVESELLCPSLPPEAFMSRLLWILLVLSNSP